MTEVTAVTAAALPSIRQRLSRTLVLVSVVWGLAAALVVWVVVQHEVDELLDNTLERAAEVLAELQSSDIAAAALIVPAVAAPASGAAGVVAASEGDYLAWQLVGPDAQVLRRSRLAPATALASSPRAGFFNLHRQWRVLGTPLAAPGRMLYVAQTWEERHEAQVEVAALTVGGTLLVGVLCALWLRTRARSELEPLHALSSSVARFNPLQGGAPLAPATRAELQPMHQAVTELAQRLARRVATERAFSAHAAHALRTPLAGMVAQLAVAQRKSSPEAAAHVQRSRDAADRLGRVVTSLLTLFRTGADVQRRHVPLADLVQHLPFDALALSCEPGASVQADPDLLAAALLNLLDNALRCGATQVHLSSQRVDEGTAMANVVRVSDNGSGIDEPLRQRLQTALDKEAYEGETGLGLMLADLVARAHGGRLHLQKSALGCVVDLGLGPAAVHNL